MVKFLHPAYLWGLLASPLIFWLVWSPITHSVIAKHLLSDNGKPNQTRLRFSICITLMYSMILVILSGVSVRQVESPLSKLSHARVFIIDMSQAMLFDDITPNRATQALYKLTDLTTDFEEGEFAVIAYTNEGYVISPLTHDRHVVQTQYQGLSPSIMPTQGRDAAAGISRALSLLQDAGFAYGDIILLTSGLGKNERERVVNELDGHSYRLSILLFNSQNASNEEQSLSSTVSELGQMTAQFGGIAAPYSATNHDVSSLLEQHASLAHFSPPQTTAPHQSDVDDGYWLLWPLTLCALLLFRRGVFWSLCLISLLPLSSPKADDTFHLFLNDDLRAMRTFDNQQYLDAAKQFINPKWQGIAYYHAGEYDAAASAFAKVEDGSADYNLATTLVRLNRLAEAKTLYQKVLTTNPNHAAASQNLAWVEISLARKADSTPKVSESEEENTSRSNKEEKLANSERSENQSQESDPTSAQSTAERQHSGEANNASPTIKPTKDKQASSSDNEGGEQPSASSNQQKQTSDMEQARAQRPNHLKPLTSSNGRKNASYKANHYDADAFLQNEKRETMTPSEPLKTDGMPTSTSSHHESLQRDATSMPSLSAQLADSEALLNLITPSAEVRGQYLKNALRHQAQQGQYQQQGDIEW